MVLGGGQCGGGSERSLKRGHGDAYDLNTLYVYMRLPKNK